VSDFKSKMHRIRFPLGLRSYPAGGAQHSPIPPTSKGRAGEDGGWERKGMGREEEGEVGKVQGKPPPQKKKIFCPRTARASSSIAMHSHVTRLYTMQQLYTPVAAGRTHDFLSV